MTRHGRLTREPLLHFVAVGAALFAAYALVRGPTSMTDDATIVVDRRALLAFMQYRANAFEPDISAAALDAMTDDELRKLVDAYVDDEIMYREAQSLGLGESDYIIRQRMIQKVGFLLGDIAATGAVASDAELREYFDAHKDDYALAASVTFTHVFFDADRRGSAAALADATAAARELNAAGAEFNDASTHGDGFPFLRNYVARTSDYVASHFGAEFAASLERLTPNESLWQGPIRSAYGQHVVLLTRRTERSYPLLADVHGDVERDYLAHRATLERAQLIDGLRRRYKLTVTDLRASK